MAQRAADNGRECSSFALTQIVTASELLDYLLKYLTLAADAAVPLRKAPNSRLSGSARPGIQLRYMHFSKPDSRGLAYLTHFLAALR